MIKELRIGNLIYYTIYGEGYPETGKTSIEEFEVSDFGDLDDISPIPLTEDWLLKFGFKYDQDKGYSSDEDENRRIFSLKGFDISIESNGKIHVWEENDQDHWYSHPKKELKFVHKLQNYFYETKDEELQLKTLAQ